MGGFRARNLVKMAQSTVREGILAINKPYNLSSAQVIRDCQAYFNPSNFFRPLLEQEAANRARESNFSHKRRGRNKRQVQVKMGHGGTLDPLATGVLILGVGKGTKSLHGFLGCTKTYETIVVFGCATDTYDRAGRVLKKRQYDHITRTMVEEALDSFRGKYQQMPPLYSALKMEGKPLYEYAREGKPLPREIATREIEVTDLELVEWYEPGTHEHRWPPEEATQAEKTYAEQLWRVEKQQATGKKLSPEEEEADATALAAHESFKRKAEERQDELVRERQSKKRKANSDSHLMSGALGDLPQIAGKGTNLIPAVAPGTPLPWDDKGPPAVKIRMTVTSGFYVRSFCHDLGEKVGSAAIMAELVRERQADYTLDDCLDYADLAKGEAVWGPKVEGLLRASAEKEAAEKSGGGAAVTPQKKHHERKHSSPARRDGGKKIEAKDIAKPTIEMADGAAVEAQPERKRSPEATPKKAKKEEAAGAAEEWDGLPEAKKEARTEAQA